MGKPLNNILQLLTIRFNFIIIRIIVELSDPKVKGLFALHKRGALNYTSMYPSRCGAIGLSNY